MQQSRKHVIMIASENDALVGGKIGGVGDVVRDLPCALARHGGLAPLGWNVTVITPSYGFLHQKNPSQFYSRVNFPFRGKQHEAKVWKVTPKQVCIGITHFVIEHEGIRGDPIYYNDPHETPFMRDATKYAMFCSAVGQFLKLIEHPFVLHLHDWHAATLFLLRELHEEFSNLKGIHTAFTIHNLAIQGTRPMRSHESSVERWFPELFHDQQWVNGWRDPRYKTPCYTPMAVGIKYADKVNTVSPSYAEEILRPSDHQNGFYGGEGLEHLLQEVNVQHRLYGILNGCEYRETVVPKRLTFSELCDALSSNVALINNSHPSALNEELLQRINTLKQPPPLFILTSVTRIVDQKIKLLFAICSDGASAIEKIMRMVDKQRGLFIILGSGTADYEQLLTQASERFRRLMFIKGYSESIARALYANGTLFVMPSSFEPCGISQMLAMRDGQPCIVHAVGGLRDTVQHGVNGFSFAGERLTSQVDALTNVVEQALDIFLTDTKQWERIRTAATNARFTWEKSAREYGEVMYV